MRYTHKDLNKKNRSNNPWAEVYLERVLRHIKAFKNNRKSLEGHLIKSHSWLRRFYCCSYTRSHELYPDLFELRDVHASEDH